MKKFIKRKEDFICEHCGFKVIGGGYTDHCPRCLWSKHVDINPGDRQAKCEGLMKPMAVEKKRGRWRIQYRCLKCGYEHWVKMAKEDDWRKIVKIGGRREEEIKN